MKKNILLFSALIALLSLVYIYEELGKFMLSQKKENASQIFNFSSLGALQRFQNSSFTLVKRDNYFWGEESGLLIDPKKLEKVFETLNGIHSKRILTTEEYQALDQKLFFNDDTQKLTFTFENGEVEFTLGNKINYSEDFYIKIKTNNQINWVLAQDTGAIDGVYDSQNAHRNPMRYQRLQRIISMSESFLQDKHIFPTHFLSNKEHVFKNIKITLKDERPCRIDFVGQTTFPPVPKFETIDTAKIIRFQKFLKDLEGVAFYKNYQGDKGKEIAEFTVVDFDDNIFRLTLYSVAEKYFFTTNLYPDSIFRVKERPSELLVHCQDFWSKAVP